MHPSARRAARGRLHSEASGATYIWPQSCTGHRVAMRDSVVITGLGVASSLGAGVEAHRRALWLGESGIGPVQRFDTARLTTALGAMWPGWADRVQAELGAESDLFQTAEAFPLHELALVAAREAWSSSGASAPPRRVALVFGTCFGQGFRELAAVTRRIAAGLDIAGPELTVSTACASSTTAIGMGRDLIARGHADVVVAGGADSLLREAMAGFSALGVLSAEPAAPFSAPEGTTLGEGAAFFVLERAERTAHRAARHWASVEGYGLSADAYHETTPHPDGAGTARALESALGDAGWRGCDVDFVSAHATGTSNNDRIEWRVIERALAGPGYAPAVSGSKGHVGHTQGASGAVELALALICHREGCVPPTKHFRGARRGCPPDPVAQETPRPLRVRRAVKLSSAFGGANSALAYACGETTSRTSRSRAPVVLHGAGLVGPDGNGGLEDVLALTSRRMVGRAGDVDKELDSFGVDPRRLDRSSRWLAAATAREFVGADALRARREEGPLERITCFLADGPVTAGHTVRFGEQSIGRVLVAAPSPTMGRTVGWALLSTRFAHPHLDLTAFTPAGEVVPFRTCSAFLFATESLRVQPHLGHRYANRGERA